MSWVLIWQSVGAMAQVIVMISLGTLIMRSEYQILSPKKNPHSLKGEWGYVRGST